MSTPTSNQILAAAGDLDLRERLIALAAQDPTITDPHAWVNSRLQQIVGVAIDSNGEATTIASVYDYAVATYQPTPPPGKNLAAVTDAHLRAAITNVKGE